MRKVTLIGVALMSTCLCGQSYRPLLGTLGTWQDESGWYNLGPNTAGYECVRYYLSGDTTINDTSYTRLLRTGWVSSQGQTWFSGQLVALLREDTVSRRVYYREQGWGEEYLFYDFSVGVGPYPATIRHGSGLLVIAVDTVLLEDGPHRRIQLNVSSAVGIEYIIEGVGSTYGLMEPMVTGGTQYVLRLVCHTQADTSVYLIDSYYCACGSNVGMTTHSQIGLSLGPSPTRDFCRVQGASPRAPFRLFGLDGRMLRSGICSNEGSATIDMSTLLSGMYVVSVNEVTGPVSVRIIRE